MFTIYNFNTTLFFKPNKKGVKDVKKLVLSILVLTTVLGTGVLALWMGGFLGSFTMTATSGEQPEQIACSKTFDITSNDNVTQTCDYENTDGTIKLQFTADTSGITSTNPACHINAEDYIYAVGIDGNNWKDFPNAFQYTVTSGTHTIGIRVKPNEHRCPASGTFTVTGVIV